MICITRISKKFTFLQKFLKNFITFFLSELSPHALYINKKMLKREDILTVTGQIFCFFGCSNLQRKRC